MSLPIFTTVDDVRGIVAYLKTKPTGATITEAKAVVDKTLVDGRKLAAYQAWGLLSRDGERLKLSDRGWEMARKSKAESATLREVLDSVHPYRSALEWANHQKFEELTNVDVAAQWHAHHKEHLGTDNENTIKDQAVCFLRLAEGAGLGSFTLGRKGQATRLSIDKSALGAYVEAGPSAPPWVEPVETPPDVTEDIDASPARAASANPILPPAAAPRSQEQAPDFRVFISHGKTMEIVSQVETMLGLADIEIEVAVKEETAAIPVPDKVFSAMKKCQAAIIVVAVEEAHKDATGKFTINENVLIEIGAAFVLYDRKVVLLWDRRLTVPSNLQGLYRCEYEGDELNWSAGMKLMKAIKNFK